MWLDNLKECFIELDILVIPSEKGVIIPCLRNDEDGKPVVENWSDMSSSGLIATIQPLLVDTEYDVRPLPIKRGFSEALFIGKKIVNNLKSRNSKSLEMFE